MKEQDKAYLLRSCISKQSNPQKMQTENDLTLQKPQLPFRKTTAAAVCFCCISKTTR